MKRVLGLILSFSIGAVCGSAFMAGATREVLRDQEQEWKNRMLGQIEHQRNMMSFMVTGCERRIERTCGGVKL